MGFSSTAIGFFYYYSTSRLNSRRIGGYTLTVGPPTIYSGSFARSWAVKCSRPRPGRPVQIIQCSTHRTLVTAFVFFAAESYEDGDRSSRSPTARTVGVVVCFDKRKHPPQHMFHLGWSTMLALAVGVQPSLKTSRYIWVTASACTEVSAKNGKMTNHTKPFNSIRTHLLFVDYLNPAWSASIAVTGYILCLLVLEVVQFNVNTEYRKLQVVHCTAHTHIQMYPCTMYMCMWMEMGRWVFKIKATLN